MSETRSTIARRHILGKGALAASLLVMTCCQTPQPPPPAPAPAPAPAPVATVAPPPAPLPVPVERAWIDRPQTAGTWGYTSMGGLSLAGFGTDQGEPVLGLQCDRSNRTIRIARLSDATGQRPMIIRTESANRALTARADSGRVVASLPANDPLFDAMAITRGRFAVEVEGETGLYVPAWAEVTRVIEDCR